MVRDTAMKALVVVISHPEARPILEMNWPWLKRGGCDIAVIDHVGSNDVADVNPLFYNRIGGHPEATKNRWVDRFVEVLEWCAWSLETKDYTHYLITESDSIFVRPVPELPEGIVATLAGYKSEGFHAKTFYHTPWAFSVSAAEDFIRRARIMLDFNLNEHGFIDRFLGAYSEFYGVPIQQMNTYTRNTIEGHADIQDARRAIVEGCFFIHGIKSPTVLAQLTEGL